MCAMPCSAAPHHQSVEQVSEALPSRSVNLRGLAALLLQQLSTI